MADIVSKGEFAALLGVTPGRVSQWLSAKQISGAAIVGSGHRARILVSVAREQLKRNLDIDQSLGMNGKASLGERKQAASGANCNPAGNLAPAPSEPISKPPQPRDDSDDDATLEERIKRQRLDQLALANEKAREEAAARSGRYVRADSSRQEMGRIASRMVAAFDGALGEFASAIAAKSNLSPRDALHILRSAFHEVRARNSQRERQAAEALPKLIDDDGSEEAAAR